MIWINPTRSTLQRIATQHHRYIHYNNNYYNRNYDNVYDNYNDYYNNDYNDYDKIGMV